MALTASEETTLRAIIKQVKDTPALTDAVKAAQAALDDANTRWFAERDTAQLAANEAMQSINLAHAPEIAQKTTALEAAKKALEDSKVLVSGVERT